MKKYFKNIYSRFRKHRKDELVRHVKIITRRMIVKELLEQRSLTSKENLLNDEPRKQKLIVSLTTFGKRITSVYLAIESIAQQTVKPDEMVLWLDEKKFSDRNLPVTLNRMIQRGLKVRFCRDLGPHTKLMHALKEYPGDLIITIDDDHIYPLDMIENLLAAHKKHPKVICCNVARRIIKNKTGGFIPYYKWERVYAKEKVSKELLPLGVHGVLYFPGCFDKEVFNLDKMMELAPKADDIWYKAMHLKNNINCMVTGAYPFYEHQFATMESASVDALYQDNVKKDLNVEQIINVFEHYNLTL